MPISISGCDHAQHHAVEGGGGGLHVGGWCGNFYNHIQTSKMQDMTHIMLYILGWKWKTGLWWVCQDDEGILILRIVDEENTIMLIFTNIWMMKEERYLVKNKIFSRFLIHIFVPSSFQVFSYSYLSWRSKTSNY